MMKFSDAGRRLAEYRICLERDVADDIIPAPAFAAVDACYVSLSALLDSARIELEAAGPETLEPALMARFLGGSGRLAQHMFAAMYQHRELEELERIAAEITRQGQALMEYLWLRIAV